MKGRKITTLALRIYMRIEGILVCEYSDIDIAFDSNIVIESRNRLDKAFVSTFVSISFKIWFKFLHSV